MNAAALALFANPTNQSPRGVIEEEGQHHKEKTEKEKDKAGKDSNKRPFHL